MRFRAALLLAVFVAAPIASACKDKGSEKSTSNAEAESDSKPKSSSSSSATAATSGSAGPATVAAAAPAGTPADAIVLDRGDGKLEISGAPDGAFALRAYDDKGGALAPADINGQVRSGEDGSWVTVEPSDKGVKAKLPKLEPGLTTVEVALNVKGKPWSDTVDVPEGGTAALQEEPKIAIAEGTKGPNGGTVDVVGDQRVELVMDEETGDVRVYFLNEKLEVMDVPPGTEITLNIEDGKADEDEPDGEEGEEEEAEPEGAQEEPAK